MAPSRDCVATGPWRSNSNVTRWLVSPPRDVWYVRARVKFETRHAAHL
jgi:hypothetical protein